MDFLSAMATGVNLAVLLLAGLAGLDLARRGGFAPAEMGMGLLGLGQMTALGETPGWGWLLRTGAVLVVIYVMWEMGKMALVVRGPAPRAPLCLQGSGEKGARVRAVASWPGRRR